MSRSRSLKLPKAPWVVKADLTDAGAQASITEAGQVGVVVEVDGSEGRTLNAFFAAVSMALNFPDYFGMNWEAFRDCLTDLCWLPTDLYLIVFKNADQLLVDEPAERASFLRIISIAAEEWSVPVALGEWWDRPTIPFHVVLDGGVSGWSSELLREIGSLSYV